MKSNAMQVMYNLCKEVTLFEFCATLYSLIISLFYGKYNNNPLGLDHECTLELIFLLLVLLLCYQYRIVGQFFSLAFQLWAS